MLLAGFYPVPIRNFRQIREFAILRRVGAAENTKKMCELIASKGQRGLLSHGHLVVSRSLLANAAGSSLHTGNKRRPLSTFSVGLCNHPPQLH